MKRDINSSAFFSLDEATTRIFRELIETKFGEKITRCCQVKKLRKAVYDKTHQYISESSYKRLFGLVKHEGERFSKAILNILALYLGYESFADMLPAIKGNSLQTPLQTLCTSTLERGSQIRVSFDKGLESFMCYIGDNNFIINRSTMPLFAKGEIFKTESISTGKCLKDSDFKFPTDKSVCSTFVTSVRIVM